jgi:DNA-binding transcriptional LysR family regulator
LSIDLEPRLIRYFLAVAEELHFGRAAARLHISQPSLSNQIQKLERTLGTQLFVRTSRGISLTTAGQVLLDEARPVLAAMERAAENVRLAGTGVAATVRLGYPPPAGFETLGTLLAAVATDNPNMTVVPSELFSAEIPGRVLASELDIGLALHPQQLRGVESEALRVESVAAVLSERHPLARGSSIQVADLAEQALLLFPRELAPAYYDSIVGACERAGFQPRVTELRNPAASLARLLSVPEVGLIPSSFAFHLAAAQDGIAARKIVDPQIPAEWSILWSSRARSGAVARFLESARRCATDSGWLPTPDRRT